MTAVSHMSCSHWRGTLATLCYDLWPSRDLDLYHDKIIGMDLEIEVHT